MRLVLVMVTFVYGLKVTVMPNYGELVKKEKCVMFMRKLCGWSQRAKALIMDRMPCHFIEVDDDRDAHDFSKSLHKTFPALFYEGNLIKGGYKEIKRRADAGLYPFQEHGSTYAVDNFNPVVGKRDS